jgi:hypothetical protein
MDSPMNILILVGAAAMLVMYLLRRRSRMRDEDGE